MTNQKLFSIEKQILEMVKGRRISVELKNEFIYEQEKSQEEDESQFDFPSSSAVQREESVNKQMPSLKIESKFVATSGNISDFSLVQVDHGEDTE